MRLVKLAKKHDIDLRQSYKRVGKHALIKQQRYAHAKQYKRAKRELRTLKTYLGRTVRDISRKITHDGDLQRLFSVPLSQAKRVMSQKPRDGGRHIYALHAPEVECIGKGESLTAIGSRSG